MARIAFVNGRYRPLATASVGVEDRGYQFADGIYEVCAVIGGRIVNIEPHLDRLDRSLAALRIPPPMARPALCHVLAEVVRRNRVVDGIVYAQVSRGAAPRDHGFPRSTTPALVVTARPKRMGGEERLRNGVTVISIADIRWGRCDIKSIALLANVLAKQEAAERGAFEAWQIDRDGYVTEGSSTNAWIVTDEGTILTRPLSPEILSGVTRLTLLRLARQADLPVAERAFTLAEAQSAREAFLTSTSNFVVPVVRIDDTVVGDGRPGATTLQLARLYVHAITGGAGVPS